MHQVTTLHLGRPKRAFCFKTCFVLCFSLIDLLLKAAKTLKQNKAMLLKISVLAYPAIRTIRFPVNRFGRAIRFDRFTHVPILVAEWLRTRFDRFDSVIDSTDTAISCSFWPPCSRLCCLAPLARPRAALAAMSPVHAMLLPTTWPRCRSFG